MPLFLIAGIGELILRRAAGVERRKNELAWAEMYADRPPLQQGLADLKDLLRASRHPRIIYELRPNISVTFRDAQVTIDEDGYRGPGLSGKPAFRVVAETDRLRAHPAAVRPGAAATR